jgi:hypothetical protein
MDKRIIKALTNPYYACNVILNRLAPYIHDDELIVKWNYFLSLHKKLNLNNPQTFNEKLQWLKLHDRHAEYTVMVDKLAVKDYIAKILGAEYVFDTIGVWNQFDDIDFSKLPNQFVLKCTHDSGGLVICKNKETLDIGAARKRINHCLKKNYFYATIEYPYKDVPHRIIAEPLMVDESGSELKDYKFFCFNGEPKFFKVDFGRTKVHHANYYDLNWNFLKFGEVVCPYVEDRHIEKPLHFDEMVDIARNLSANIPFVRIDLYNINGRIYLGEITFFPASGTGPFYPEEWDYKIGQLLTLPKI